MIGVILGAVLGATSPPISGDLSWSIPQVDLDLLFDSVRDAVLAAQSKARQAPDDPGPTGQLGILYYGHGRFTAAAVCFRRAAGLDPDPLRWWYYTALAHDKGQEVPSAIEALERALAVSEYAPAHVKLADLLLETDPKRAEDSYRRAAELDGGLASAHLGLGRCALVRGERAAALRHIQQAVDLDPSFASAHYELAMLLRAEGRMSDALEHLRLFRQGADAPFRQDPLLMTLLRQTADTRVRTARAEALWKAGRGDEARSVVRAILETDPDRRSVHALLGVAYMRQGLYEEGADQFRQLLEIDPNSIEAKGHLAEALFRTGRSGEAEQLLQEAIALHPDGAANLLRMATLLAERGSDDDALELLRRAAAAQPADPRIRRQLGRVLTRLGRHEEAIEQLRAAVELDPGDAAGLMLLGQLLVARGDRDEARLVWEAAIDAQHRFMPAYASLAALAAADADYERAEAVLRQGIAQAPQSPILIGRLAWLLATCPQSARRGGTEAVELAERACRMTQNANPQLLAVLAAAYAEATRFDEAVETQRRAIELVSRGGPPGTLAEHRNRLLLYESRRPYRSGG